MIREIGRAVRAKGLAGTVRSGLRLARGSAAYSSTFIWYALALDGDRPRSELSADHRLRRASEGDARTLFAQLQPDEQDPRGSDFAERVAQSGVPWVVDAGGRPAFTCWTFRERAPISALPSGWLELPARAAVLEDSITSSDFRGQGIAPRAWTALADGLRDDGYDQFLTKVGKENQASRRAVEKAGFREVATMDVRQNGPRVRLKVAAPSGNPVGAQLVRLLDGRGRWAFS